ncbi:MAG: class I SAM-dependent methyltransferase [Acetobacteraceae bacterium]|nr:class I SAM-dependent methyltransferase [Acetobacteraceae bacterium]
MASHCRFCAKPLTTSFADLGMSPLSNAYVAPENAKAMERFYPLHAYVCDGCHLVQLEEFETPEAIFSDYLYFSSFAASWVEHARRYAAAMTERFGLTPASRVVEVASNDGYLLQWFVQAGIPVLGVEPAANVAEHARAKGVESVPAFFGEATARELREKGFAADLMAANNVLAHVPDIRDFTRGFAVLLKPEGVATFEFPHLLQLMRHNQFDTIYHEHFSYLSLLTAQQVMAAAGLRVFDVEELPTHGGSLRLYTCRAGASHAGTPAIARILAEERAAGLDGMAAYAAFARQVVDTKAAVLDFFVAAHRAGKRVVGYGAPAKGNTLLNYCGIGPEFLPFTVDRSPHKQGMLLPGTHIPIRAPEAIFEAKPDYVFILPWNLADEITRQMAGIRDWGGRFVVPIPRVTILP